MMEQQSNKFGTERTQTMVWMLEVGPDDPRTADAALVKGVSDDVVQACLDEGDTVQPIYTGIRGGPDILVEITTTLVGVATALWATKEVILSDVSALVTIFTPVAIAIERMRKAYEQRAGKEVTQQQPVKITVTVDGVTMVVEDADGQRAEEIAMALAQRLLASAPRAVAQMMPQSSVKLKATVPPRPQRKRR